MRASDLKVGMEVYVIIPSVVGFKEFKKVEISKVDLGYNSVRYMEHNDIAKKKIGVVAQFENVVEINTHNKWLFAKAKSLHTQFNAIIDSNIRVFDSAEKLEPEIVKPFFRRRDNPSEKK